MLPSDSHHLLSAPEFPTNKKKPEKHQNEVLKIREFEVLGLLARYCSRELAILRAAATLPPPPSPSKELCDYLQFPVIFEDVYLSYFFLFSRRTRSLNAPSPIQQFGPCGRIMKNSAMVM